MLRHVQLWHVPARDGRWRHHMPPVDQRRIGRAFHDPAGPHDLFVQDQPQPPVIGIGVHLAGDGHVGFHRAQGFGVRHLQDQHLICP